MMAPMFFLILGCDGPLSSTLPTETKDTGEDTGERTPAIQHCGTISADERWEADQRHRVTCNVEVESGTLTIAAGTTVEFDAGVELTVGAGDVPASLVVDGSAAGVIFVPRGEEAWAGLSFGPNAVGVSLSGLAMRTTTKGLVIDGAEVRIGSLAIDGASSGCGLTLEGGARLAEGSTGVMVTGAGTWAVCAEVASVDSLPAQASGYTGNGRDGVYLKGTQLTAPVTWENLGVPYVLADTVDVGGTAAEPAILTLTEGTALRFERDGALRFSRTGAASALHALGTAAEPVTLDAFEATTAGYWQGIDVSDGTESVQLVNVTVTAAGGKTAAIIVEDAPLLAQGLRIERSATAGLLLEGSATFAEGSADLTVHESEIALVVPPAAVPSIPSSGVDLSGNSTEAVKVAGVSAVATSGEWADLGLPYWIDDNIDINGTADAPALVSLNPGLELRFTNGKGIFVGKSGAAGLRVRGTEEAPVTMVPWSAYDPGAWAGVGIYDAAVDSEVVLEHLAIGYAGGTTLKGNLQITDASPMLSHVSLHDSLEWGIYVSGASDPILGDVTYAGNTSGECCGCP